MSARRRASSHPHHVSPAPEADLNVALSCQDNTNSYMGVRLRPLTKAKEERHLDLAAGMMSSSQDHHGPYLGVQLRPLPKPMATFWVAKAAPSTTADVEEMAGDRTSPLKM